MRTTALLTTPLLLAVLVAPAALADASSHSQHGRDRKPRHNQSQDAGPDPRPLTFRIHSDFDEPPSASTPCNPLSATCVVDTSGPTFWHGDIVGRSDYLLHTYVDPTAPTDLAFDGPNNFRATTYVRGCGVGSFVVSNVNGREHLAQFDPATQTAPGENDWTIVPGSGTGQLRGISGHGVDHYRDASLAIASVSDPSRTYYGYADGVITCVPRG